MAKEIEAREKSLREILNHKKYKLEYYQREYVWQERQVQELIEDLTSAFEKDYKETHNRREVKKSYKPYFMGSIIVCEPNERSASSIIDGQQRLTSLTLLLIFLYHNLNQKDKDKIIQLIKSCKSGKFSFNLNVPERKRVMESLLKNQEISKTLIDNEESLTNLVKRYENIENYFPENIKEDKILPYFTDWLLNKAIMSKITTRSVGDAYVIFTTMNERGRRLTKTEMLKSYLLANIKEKGLRDKANKCWKKNIQKLKHEYQEWDLESYFIKDWLRGQYAKKLRADKGDTNNDFDLIETEFHCWVIDNSKSIGLERSEDFSRFIEEDFRFYSHWYIKLCGWAYEYDPKFLPIYSNDFFLFDLQFPAILAALKPQDKKEERIRKIKIVSTYIDILLARRIWNYEKTTESALKDHIFSEIIKKIRGKSVNKIAQILKENLNETKTAPTFDLNYDDQYLILQGNNNRKIRLILARITDYIETESKNSKTRFDEYINQPSPKDNRFEIEHFQIEHIVGDKKRKYPKDLYEKRNVIGGLLLLPEKVNKSIGKIFDYKEKKKTYRKQNLLASSLHKKTYKDNLRFERFRKRYKLPFEPYDKFDMETLNKRFDLYLEIAKRIWDPERLTRIAEGKE